VATVAQVLNAALKRILVQGAAVDLDPEEYQDAIFAMNNYMLALDAQGVTLGYTVVNNLAQTVTVPTGALRGLIANVAIECAPDYNGIVSPQLEVAAADGLNTMRLIGQRMGATRFPSTLPMGSGNEGQVGSGWLSHFYPDEEAAILAETTGAIGLEEGTDAAAGGP